MAMQFDVTGRVTDCLRLTYRTPAETVRGMLPDGLELVERGPWAFWDVVCERVDRARPVGVPAFCGVGFTRVSYRLRAQAMNDRAEVVRGGYETRCDLSKRTAMCLIRTAAETRPSLARIDWHAGDCGTRFEVRGTTDAYGDLEIDTAHAPARLLPGSCFPTASDAQQFNAATLNCINPIERGGRRLLGVTHERGSTNARAQTPVLVRNARLDYFESIGQDKHMALEWASRLSAAEIRWESVEAAGLLAQRTPEPPVAEEAVCLASS